MRARRVNSRMPGARHPAPLAAVLAAVILLVLSLAGCGGLPTTSGVTTGLRPGGPAIPQPRVVPNPPPLGAGPEAVAEGFLRTLTTYDVGHAVAKTYLANPGSHDWTKPLSVTVLDKAPRIRSSATSIATSAPTAKATSAAPATAAPATAATNRPTNRPANPTYTEDIHLSGTVVATISQDGRYTTAKPGTRVTTTWGAVKVSGEWRLVIPDQPSFSAWISAADLGAAYSPHALHYVTKTGRHLVQDVRWFAGGPNLATTLTQAQLEYPPAYLTGAVATAVPAGTRLVVDSVPVRGGVAVVDLTAPILDADEDTRKAVWAQLVATLTTIPEVGYVDLRAEGHSLEIAGVPSPVGSSDSLGYAVPRPVSADWLIVRTGRRILRIDPTPAGDRTNPRPTPTTINAPLPAGEIPPDWVDLALSADSSQIGGVTTERTQLSLWRGDVHTLVDAFATDLTQPSFDGEGLLWVAGVAPSGEAGVWFVGPGVGGGKPRPSAVSAPWLTGRRVVFLKVSPDGSRVLVGTRPGDKPGSGADRVDIAGIVRNPNGQAAALAMPLRVADTVTADVAAVRAVWADNQTFALLQRDRGGLATALWSIGLGELTMTGPKSAPAAITCLAAQDSLVVVTTGGVILRRSTTGWEGIGKGTDALAPGR